MASRDFSTRSSACYTRALSSLAAGATPVHSADPIVAAFDRQVEHDPGRALIIGPNERMSRGDVDARVRAAAQALQAAALPAGGLVGLLAPNGSGFLAAFVACLRLEHPVVLLDAGMTAEELDRVGSRLGMTAVLRAGAGLEVERRSESTPRGCVDGSVIKLTSGSSGEPRGVVTSSAAVLADGDALRRVMRIDEHDRLVAMVPFSHAYGLGALVIPALVAGIPLVVPAGGSPFEPLRIAAGTGATVLPTVPAWVAALARLKETPAWPASLVTVITAGAPLLPAAAAAFRKRFGVPIHVLYGASEAGAIAYDRGQDAGENGTVGEPLEGVLVELLPSGDPGGAGQIVVRSAAVAASYYPDASPSLGDGRFVSQDLAVLEGRALRLVGRLDQVINIKGLKVHPHEIERVIAQMSFVDDVVVDATHDREPVLRAIVASESGAVQPDHVIAWCRGRLSDHKVPRRVLVVRSIPRTARAKLDRAALESLDHA